jgi:hypothetical protein
MEYMSAGLQKCTELYHSQGIRLVFGKNSRTSTDLPIKNQYTAYGEYIIKLINNLSQPQFTMTLNIIQAKYRPKFYYDKNTYIYIFQHFQENEMIYAEKKPRNGKLDAYYERYYIIVKINYVKNNVDIHNNMKILHIDKKKSISTERDSRKNTKDCS